MLLTLFGRHVSILNCCIHQKITLELYHPITLMTSYHDDDTQSKCNIIHPMTSHVRSYQKNYYSTSLSYGRPYRLYQCITKLLIG